jgi:hypothetical protein
MAASADRPAAPERHPGHSWAGIVDTGTYWAGLAAVYIAFGFLWYYGFKEKVFDENGNMPAELAKLYKGTVLDSFPGLDATWTILGILEGLAGLAFIASLVSGEFLPRRRKPILLSGLAFSMFVFAVMTFGQNLVGNYEGVASLFVYMGVTAIVYVLLRSVPGFRGEAETQ